MPVRWRCPRSTWRAIIDMSQDTGGYPEGGEYGYIVDHPHLRIRSLSQEVGIIVAREGILDLSRYPIGSKLRIIPNHSCLSAACFPEAYLLGEDDCVKQVWKTCPRGW
eukprot:TRINITY_DN1276_c0_g1_i15.p3 TRINITY_DN1276_c0_g1~~TRINITY_DN1276_c0_g1_i15.p3  ORF type:complete len:108 (-),score=7.15 TRINITY_DN1276_c0_g1_i15:36-359(-)